MTDKWTAIPGCDEIVTMCSGLIQAYCAADIRTAARITIELEKMGTTIDDLATVLAVVAASMLQEATGSSARASQLAAAATARRARLEGAVLAEKIATTAA